MELKSEIHGTIEYTEKNKVVFSNGIPGFKDLRDFIIVDLDNAQPFKLLHSLEDLSIGLVLTSPFEIKKDYEFELKDEVVKRLNIEAPEDVMVLTTVTLNSDIKKMTTNLKAPIIVNVKLGIGEQIIIDNEKYKTKHPLMGE